jgi:hypothetical protein
MTRRNAHGARRDTASGPAPPPTQPDENSGTPPKDQAKRRLPSSQEIRDGARPDPSNREDPRSGYPSSSKLGQWLDVIAFISVLTTGCVLIVIGHLTIGSLTAACGALISLFGAWRHFRT